MLNVFEIDTANFHYQSAERLDVMGLQAFLTHVFRNHVPTEVVGTLNECARRNIWKDAGMTT